MKNCTDCKHADWKRTEAGRLHPSGDGKCRYEYKAPPLPASMYWLKAPIARMCAINRRQELPTHCAYFDRKEGT